MRNFIMPFGKYAGVPLGDIPISYLKWLINEDVPKYALKAALKELEEEIWEAEVDDEPELTLRQYYGTEGEDEDVC